MHVILAMEYTFVTNAPIISAAGRYLGPSRLPEAAAQPASSLRVRRVHALQVRRPCVCSARLSLERELPANLVGITLLAR